MFAALVYVYLCSMPDRLETRFPEAAGNEYQKGTKPLISLGMGTLDLL